MGIGVSIFLIAVGLILALAVSDSISGVDLTMVGWILTAVGVLGLVLFFTVFGSRSRPAARPAARGEVVEERRTYDDRI